MINRELTHLLQTWAKSNPRLLRNFGLCAAVGTNRTLSGFVFCTGNLNYYYPFFSGNITFPVLHPDYPAEEGYNCTQNMYEGAYGNRRLQLFQGLATAEVHEIEDQLVVKLTKPTSPNHLRYQLVDNPDCLAILEVTNQGIIYELGNN